jgi:hypothetical protein
MTKRLDRETKRLHALSPAALADEIGEHQTAIEALKAEAIRRGHDAGRPRFSPPYKIRLPDADGRQDRAALGRVVDPLLSRADTSSHGVGAAFDRRLGYPDASRVRADTSSRRLRFKEVPRGWPASRVRRPEGEHRGGFAGRFKVG